MKGKAMQRVVEFSPAFDKRHPDPKQNYGVHGVELRMVQVGEQGAVQFLLYTNWMLPHVEKEQDSRWHDHTLCHPMPADLGYHSKVPTYEEQSMTDTDCKYTGGVCYYDGSGLQ